MRYFMSSHNNFRMLIIIFLCFFSSCIYAFKEKENALFKKEIKHTLDENRKKYNLPAISLSLKLPISNKIENYVSGYYSFSKDKDINPDTLFQIGSITKTFTATIIFKLIEENKLHYSDNLGKWFPQYPRWKDITIYDLLHHTSGVYNYTAGESFDKLLRNNPQKNWSLNELAQLAYKHADLFDASKKYNYTNTDYVLLGMVIEKVTNKSIQAVFDDYLKQCNLSNTFYSPSKYPKLVKNRMAHGYNQDGTFKFNTDVTFISMSFGQSAGSMISTPSDLVKWLNDLFTGKIITSASLENMTRILSEKDVKVIDINKISMPTEFNNSKLVTELGIGAGIGLVYFRNNRVTWVHAGGTPGYESFYAYSPCNGVYLALAYNVKPKQQLVFIKIADEIFKILNNSAYVVQAVKVYQKDNLLPSYCNKDKE